MPKEEVFRIIGHELDIWRLWFNDFPIKQTLTPAQKKSLSLVGSSNMLQVEILRFIGIPLVPSKHNFRKRLMVTPNLKGVSDVKGICLRQTNFSTRCPYISHKNRIPENFEGKSVVAIER